MSGAFHPIEGLGRSECKYNQKIFENYRKNIKKLRKTMGEAVVEIGVHVRMNRYRYNRIQFIYTQIYIHTAK